MEDRFFDQCPIFAGVRPETRALIAQYAIPELVAANRIVVEQDAAWPYLGFLRSGCLFAVLTTSIGRDQLIFEVHPNETFGETPACDGGATAARYVAAGGDAEIFIVPRTAVNAAVARDATFARALASACARRMRSVTARLSAQISRPTISRLAAVIYPYASSSTGLAGVGGTLLHMNQTQLAIAAGTVKTVANRELAKLEAGGAIERRRGRIVKANRQRLSEFL